MRSLFKYWTLIVAGIFSLINTNLTFAQDESNGSQVLDKIVAIVSDNIIIESELEQQVDFMQGQLRASNIDIPSRDVMRQQVLDRLINRELQLQLADRVSIRVTNAEVDEVIDGIASSNNITVDRLKQELANEGIDFHQYWDNIRKELTISHVQQEAVGRKVVITDQQVETYLRSHPEEIQNNLQYHVRNILVPVPEFPSSEQVISAEQKAHELIDQINEGADFTQLAVAVSRDQLALEGGDLGWRQAAALPGVFAREVVNMEEGEVIGPIRAGNGFHLIKLEGVRGIEQYTVTLTHPRQILLKIDPNNSPETVKTRLNELREQIVDGADFSQLAQAYSQDMNTAYKGGDLGWLRPGETVAEFERALEQLNPGEISTPVRTQYGWHLIQVLEKRTEDDTENQLKQQTRTLLYQRRYEEAVEKWLRQLHEQVYINILT